MPEWGARVGVQSGHSGGVGLGFEIGFQSGVPEWVGWECGFVGKCCALSC